ncbi:hypothetical protein B0H10DRAFT_1967236 [Mycena sp. CBHHK59/15]|nr:hypothetical protein B0H10DRAFT_1967236 [Mycena sp. CBHHK59/15]
MQVGLKDSKEAQVKGLKGLKEAQLKCALCTWTLCFGPLGSQNTTYPFTLVCQHEVQFTHHGPDAQTYLETDSTPKSEKCYMTNTGLPQPTVFDDLAPDTPSLPFLDAPEETPGAIPAYESTALSEEKAAKIRQNVAHMNELRAEEPMFLQILLSLHHSSQLPMPRACGKESHLRMVVCTQCLQAELLCPQCWLNKHRTMPTHWVFVWNKDKWFLEKHDFSQVMKNTVIGIGHYGQCCPNTDMAQSFTLVDPNGIHATAITFCWYKTPDGERSDPEFQQPLRAGIFPGSVKDSKTGYTLGLLDYYRQQQSQGKGSTYNFVHILQRMADPYFAGAVLDIYLNFLAITRYHQSLHTTMQHGPAHGLEVPLPGEVDCLYLNHPKGYRGLNCVAGPERGVNMPLVVHNLTLEGNFKANLFFKRDDGSDTALTDGNMYFPRQTEFKAIAKVYVVSEEDKEVPCKAHIGSIRHQGQVKHGNTAVSGVVACMCDHAVMGSFVDMLKGEVFALGTFAQHEQLQHTNSPPHGPESTTPTVFSYDSWCSFVVNLVNRAITLFPEEEWLHMLLASVEGQIPADHINGHGLDCQTIWQVVYFACRGHFHGETAEVLWAFLNPLGSSTHQMTGAARHDIINFVMDAWNTLKVLRQAPHGCGRGPQLTARDRSPCLVTAVANYYKASQGESSKCLSARVNKSMLASMIAEERVKSSRKDGSEPSTSVAQWIHDGMSIQRQQVLVIALLKSHKEHLSPDTWTTIIKLWDTLNLNLKKFRERQREIFLCLTLSALDVDEPELTAIQLPSYHMKHGQWPMTGLDAHDQDSQLWEGEIKLRCREADNSILAVRAASLALSAVKKAWDLDYRGEAGITCSQRNLQKVELMKSFEITMYNNAQAVLIHLGHMTKDAVEPYQLLSHRDTRRKETHLHRVKGDSRLFDGTAWYLQRGVTILCAAVASTLSPGRGEQLEDSEDDEPRLLVGTQMLKRSGGGFKHGQCSPKRLKDIAPDDVDMESTVLSEAEDSDLEMSLSKQGKWKLGKERGKKANDTKLAEYKKESDRVQWFCDEAEMYRWLEQNEHKHAELMHVIERFHHDSVVWAGMADHEEERNGGLNGAVMFARMQAAMHRRLEHNAKVSATSFNKLVTKIDKWREVVLKWMDKMRLEISTWAGPLVPPPVLGNLVGSMVWLLVIAQPHRI